MHEDVYKFGGIKGVKGEWFDLEEQREKDTWMTAQQMLRDLESRMNKVEYGRKEGRDEGWFDAGGGINAWLSAHLHICTSAHANVSTGGDDAWVAAQADAFLLLLLHTAHLESRMRKEGRKDWRIV